MTGSATDIAVSGQLWTILASAGHLIGRVAVGGVHQQAYFAPVHPAAEGVARLGVLVHLEGDRITVDHHLQVVPLPGGIHAAIGVSRQLRQPKGGSTSACPRLSFR
jgi:hypothetical protein